LVASQRKMGARKKKSPSLLDDASWKAVPTTANLFGGEEGGFMCLEVMDDPEMMAQLYPGVYGKGGKRKGAGGDGASKRRKGDSPEEEEEEEKEESAGDGADTLEGGDDMAALMAKVAALEKKNKLLEKKMKKKEKKKAEIERKATAKKAGNPRKGEGNKTEQGELEEPLAQANDPQPLADISSWRPYDLHPHVGLALARLGFSHPTPVQAECIPAAVRDRRDIVGAAQTGSGKTLAFGIPIMQRILQDMEAPSRSGKADDGDDDVEDGGQAETSGTRTLTPMPIRALILAPTRELAMQVCKHLKAIGDVCGIGVVPIVGGLAATKQERLLRHHPAVVVATPGRLWDLMKQGEKHLVDMRQLSFFVIDEADRMMQHGQYVELSSILDHINSNQSEYTPQPDEVDVPAVPELEATESMEAEMKAPERPPQIYVFSATLTLPQELRRRLRKGGGGAGGNSATLEGLMDKLVFRSKPKIVDLTGERKVADKVQEAYVDTAEEDRDDVLYYLLAAHPGSTIIFANAISTIRRLAALLRLLGLPAAPLHAGMQQRARLKALDRFASGQVTVLVASDVAARGLDVRGVRCVVHYQLPASVDIYVHRSGRTARAEEDGLAVCFVCPKERGRFIALQRALNRDPPPEFPIDGNLMPAVRARVRLAVRLDDLERRQTKAKKDTDWAVRTARELDIELDEEPELGEDDQGKDNNRKKKKKACCAPAAPAISPLPLSLWQSFPWTHSLYGCGTKLRRCVSMRAPAPALGVDGPCILSQGSSVAQATGYVHHAKRASENVCLCIDAKL